MKSLAAITRFVGVTAFLLGFLAPQVHAATPMVTAGEHHTVALKNNGTVVAFGDDRSGQLGLGRLLRSNSPLMVVGLGQVRALAAGDSHSVALKQDGTVWAWGDNNFGQLGNGANADAPQSSKPLQVTGFVDAIAIAAGEYHTVALKQDGTVWAWGSNWTGALGDGTATNSSTPVKVLGLTGVTSIAAGSGYTMAVKQDGTVWGWGGNFMGQLGDGTTTERELAIQVPGLTGVSAIAVGSGTWLGEQHTVALKQDGTVWTWGANLYGQLGDGTKDDRSRPVQVLGLTGIVAIAAGQMHTVALKQDGTVWAWGGNSNGQRGYGESNDFDKSLTPVQVPGITGVAAIEAGKYHTLALKQDGTVWGWGLNADGQLGEGTNTDRGAPVQVQGLISVAAVAGGRGHTLALNQDGAVLAWGGNLRGQLGDSSDTYFSGVPVEVRGLTGATAVAAGESHTAALKQDGIVWAWGANNSGQLGDGTYTNRSTPTQVLGLTGVTAVAAADAHTVALKQDGTVWAWGNNFFGQLGTGEDNLYYPSNTPVQVPGLTGVIAIAARGSHTFALKQDGTVWGWGDDLSAQLGDGTTNIYRSSPVQVLGLTGVTALAAGTYYTMALKQDGTVWAWGENLSGQLGDGTDTDRSTPVQVLGLTGVSAITAGYNHSVALRQDGTVWVWGGNLLGQLGDGTTDLYRDTLTPRQLPGLAGFSAIAAGPAAFTIALKKDGTVWTWGTNDFGQLGDGTFAQHRSPVLVVNEAANGYLSLTPGTDFEVPPGVGVPFFVLSSGEIGENSASISTRAKFNAADEGKSGAVFVTARVPPGSLVPAQSSLSAFSAHRPVAFAGATPDSFVLIQLTSSGWQPVVNGQLIAYTSGVLGDQIAAQAILSGTDTTNLKGAQFCLGYGTSADQMIAAGMMRVVATIPDPTGATAPSCLVSGPSVSYSLAIPPGWNLLGNSLNQTLSVAPLYGDANTVITVWKWDPNALGWQFYTPQMDAAVLQSYAAGKGYGVLSVINPGEGYWVNAKAQSSPATQSGDSYILMATSLVKGWNLVATGNDITPSAFNTNLKASLPGTGVTTLWAWDNASSKWYFYAPSLEAQGATALSDYIASKGYLDFTLSNKTLGNGVGFWVNRP